MKILAVEDDVVILMDIVYMLAELGHECQQATSAEHALEIFEAGHGIDLVMTDLTMPGMSGLHLVRAIRQRAPQTRIIVCSGSDEIDHADLAGYEHLEKPFSAEQLAQALMRAMTPK